MSDRGEVRNRPMAFYGDSNKIVAYKDCKGYAPGDYPGPLPTVSEARALYLDLADQWFTNHAEHCGKCILPWPHEGICNWPLPPSLEAISQSELHLLLLQVSGEPYGLRLEPLNDTPRGAAK